MAEVNVTRYAAATATTVYGKNPPFLALGSHGVPVLAPRDRSAQDVDADFLSSIALRAAAAASSLACGSVLAGTTSESDEHGDVAFWLGEGDFASGHELEILDALSLRARMTSDLKVQHVELSPSTHLPVSLHARPTEELAKMKDTLSRLRSLHCFRLEGLEGDESLVLYILLGQLTTPSGSAPWLGLMGIAIWS
ncbi:hypothetical protein DAEQUDRAFT_339295 [Daedalea quercina L-15889]|uniref:Uncharacterized protein n=1 Tax=Daedalea quercina L-15889 TaxID=1314783 RepID=A0A165PKL8_9APHY|nr:hypothetical protein DAEQUDRAFT_339295 [Daedalea quercina L-15889]